MYQDRISNHSEIYEVLLENISLVYSILVLSRSIQTAFNMKFSLFIVISTVAGYVAAASIPLEQRDDSCSVVGEYCCTWEGCKDCCTYCELSIDAAQGYCRFDLW